GYHATIARMPTASAEIVQVCQRLQDLAERDPRRVVPLARRALEACRNAGAVTYAWASYTLGWALLCWERFDAALPYLHDAQDVFTVQGVVLGTLRCRYALLLIDLMQRLNADLLPHFASLAEALVDAGMPQEALVTNLYQAVLLNIVGRPRDAEALLVQVEP